jgi:hypothetical protein
VSCPCLACESRRYRGHQAAARAAKGRRPQPRFPLDPLLELVTDGPWLVSDVARRLGVTPRAVYRWMADGVPLASADWAACRLGRHPGTIWSDWWTVDPR